MARAVHRRGGLWVAPAAPGFDARLLGGRKVVPRRDGRDAARGRSTSRWARTRTCVGLISWNEYSENSHVEPSREDGGRALAVLADALGARPASTGDLDSSQSSPTGAQYGLPLLGAFAVVLAGRRGAARPAPAGRPPATTGRGAPMDAVNRSDARRGRDATTLVRCSPAAMSESPVLARLGGRLRRLAGALALVAALLALAAPGAFAAAPQLKRYPYLTDATSGGVTVNWGTDRTLTTGTLRWGRVGVESCTANAVTAIAHVGDGRQRRRVPVDGAARAPATAPRFCYRVFGGTVDLLGADASPAGRQPPDEHVHALQVRRARRLGPGLRGGQPGPGRRHEPDRRAAARASP